MTDAPALSVIVITNRSYDVCRRSMAHARRQTYADRTEIVLVAAALDGLNPDMDDLNAFGAHQIVEAGDFASTGDAIAAGVRAARAPVVCYLEEHDYVPSDYAEKIIEGMARTDAQAAGYAMAPANPGLVSWAHLYLQFGEVAAPVTTRTARRLGGHHVAYRRDMLLGYGAHLRDVMTNEGIIFEDLRKAGHDLHVLPDLVVEHVQVSTLRLFVRAEFVSQQIYAHNRATVQNWSVPRRAIYALGAPLIPILRVSRAVREIHRSGRTAELMPQILPVMIAAAGAGALGEAIGYLVGSGQRNDSIRAGYELNRYAYVRDADRATIREAGTE